MQQGSAAFSRRPILPRCRRAAEAIAQERMTRPRFRASRRRTHRESTRFFSRWAEWLQYSAGRRAIRPRGSRCAKAAHLLRWARIPPTLLDDARLRVRRVCFDSLVPEAREIDRGVLAVSDKLRNRATCGGRVHHSVSREARDRIQILRSTIPASDHGIAIELALLVQTGPGAVAFCGFQRRKPVRYRRPHDALEVIMVDVEVEATLGVSIDDAAGKSSALRAERHARNVLHVRQTLHRRSRREVMFEPTQRRNRQ